MDDVNAKVGCKKIDEIVNKCKYCDKMIMVIQ